MTTLKLATPCSMIWERMQGTGAVRHCQRCRLDVHDLSALTTAEAERLLGQPGICATFFRRADGRVLTKDCRGGFSEHFWKRMNAARHRGLFVRVAVAVGASVIAVLLAGSERLRTLREPEPLIETRPSKFTGRMTGKLMADFSKENSGY